MIPETKKSVVERALQSAFGTKEFQDIHQLTAGLSTALIYRIVVLDKPYLLRIITRTDAIGDLSHELAGMQPASDAGIAPCIRYASKEDRILITDFIEAKPFPMREAAIQLPVTIKRVHSLPPFHNRLIYLERGDGFIRKFQSEKILPENMTADLIRQYERIKSVYPWNEKDLVSCHNDMKPENIIYDGSRPWLVDWEAAFLNDRYLDLSMVANFVVTNDDEEKEYLERYSGKEATEYQLAQFFLMRQILHLLYGTFLLSLVAGSGTTIDLNLSKEDFREFHNGMWTGKISLAGNEARQQYAFVHLEQMRRNLQLKRFEDSLRIIADNPLS
ncbi:MAG: phosphotransferase [Bacteroidota bacterium]